MPLFPPRIPSIAEERIEPGIKLLADVAHGQVKAA